MSGFNCAHCGEAIDLFKIGGGEKAADNLHIQFLGRIPININIVTASDEGRAYIHEYKNEKAAKNMKEIVSRVMEIVETEQAA